ncbi:MAG: hypothetical protein NG747_09890 [Candidatus Brocadia sp.]|nr:hypothetical protein [Candidatus Brocadia sp.]
MKLFQRLLSLFTLIVFFLPVGCVVYPELVDKGPNAPKSERCGDCHRDIYNEWKDSPHARSFVSDAFKEETNEYRYKFCIGCHAPETIFTNEKIEPRSVNQTEGVNCNSCHLDDCKLSGPTPARGPHPIKEKNLFYKTSEMCGKCHVGTLKSWQESGIVEGKKTCQDCHMPVIKRKLIQDDPWQKIYPKREGKQHLFSFQPFLKENENPIKMSFVKVIRSECNVEGILELENTDVPHSVPTGDYGYREIVVTIELQDKTGRIVDFKTESLFVELKTALQYKEKRTIPFYFNCKEGAETIKAKMVRASFCKDRNILLTEASYKL